MARELVLTKGKVALVDDEDYEWLNQWKWTCHYSPKTDSYYAFRNVPNPDKPKLANGKTGRDRLLLHRFILGVEHLSRESPVDHIDSDGLNNQRSNIRIADCSLNNANRGATKRNKSGLKGIHWTGCRWRASVTAYGVHYDLGCFKTKEEAHAAYMKAAIEHFGEFANAG